MEYTISLIYGSVRGNRQGIKAALYLKGKLKERDYKIHFIDPVEYKLPLLDKMYKEFPEGQAPEKMEQVARKLSGSDGFLIVAGEYNHGVPPALKNLLDHFQKEYFFKPSAIASYSGGHFGGVRSAMQLRAILAELGSPSISTILPIPKVGDSFTEEGILKNEKIGKNVNQFLDEFHWYMEALSKQKKEKGTPF